VLWLAVCTTTVLVLGCFRVDVVRLVETVCGQMGAVS